MTSSSGNLYSLSPNSGTAMITPPSADGTQIQSGTLEDSNVDLTSEFSNMIVAQRSFEANARTVTTSDELLQDIMQLKR